MNGALTRALFHLDRAKGLVTALADVAAIETRLPACKYNSLPTSLRVVREELVKAERNLREAGTWRPELGAGDRLRGIPGVGTKLSTPVTSQN